MPSSGDASFFRGPYERHSNARNPYRLRDTEPLHGFAKPREPQRRTHEAPRDAATLPQGDAMRGPLETLRRPRDAPHDAPATLPRRPAKPCEPPRRSGGLVRGTHSAPAWPRKTPRHPASPAKPGRRRLRPLPRRAHRHGGRTPLERHSGATRARRETWPARRPCQTGGGLWGLRRAPASRAAAVHAADAGRVGVVPVASLGHPADGEL